MPATGVHQPGSGRPQAAKHPRAPPRVEPSKAVEGKPPAITSGVRRAMTAEAAYYRAERRGFEPGHEIDDWIAAEAEIERATAPHPGDEPSLCGD